MLNRAAIVVPAHDEELLLPACLDALATALSEVDLPVSITVVADACSDRTAAIARAHGVRVLEIAARNVGIARATGFTAALADGADGLWLATTDADSQVPRRWLADQLTAAADGVDVVAGTVTVDSWAARPPWLPAVYTALYATDARHVHGANLAFTATAYQSVAGFAPLACGEDNHLVDLMRHAHLRVWHTDHDPVVTSARPSTRCTGGFATHLAELTETGVG
ncbi:glycosyltransferase [Actinokineospora sp. NBRC 105648]|uniref:glycosyltransferase n=1 Tax=Actinokineospora sp. NBRC 105648 TaxID=3032206 RepID=UPI0024A0052A|nr:glycosyltransferase [Actinokineospora sp. NBRC 105648]GLZ43748.1 glycosyl transferase [Actinokineospora sp. NBRC 105648]